jgi:hypothetical protein
MIGARRLDVGSTRRLNQGRGVPGRPPGRDRKGRTGSRAAEVRTECGIEVVVPGWQMREMLAAKVAAYLGRVVLLSFVFPLGSREAFRIPHVLLGTQQHGTEATPCAASASSAVKSTLHTPTSLPAETNKIQDTLLGKWSASQRSNASEMQTGGASGHLDCTNPRSPPALPLVEAGNKNETTKGARASLNLLPDSPEDLCGRG